MKPLRELLMLLACAAHATSQDAPPATPQHAPPSEPHSAAPDAPPADAQAARTGGWRLANTNSPYLRAHADNPVEWFPWGEEAFARARELDRPIFLSIGYSACHWCHRMEHDTFEDAECARLLNELFVSIKVDREERPDIDSRAMQSLALITGGGGWPASLFLTPDGLAFAGGTYFPPGDTPERPGFRSILTQVSDLWRTQREAVLEAGRELNEALLRDPLAAPDGAATEPGATVPGAPETGASKSGTPDTGASATREPDAGARAPDAIDIDARAPGAVDLAALVDRGLLELAGSLDAELGGTFGTPKFPPALTLSFLLGQQARRGVDTAQLVRTSLDAMAVGGLHDHVGGGFHRYCVDAEWKVPHFEKMLGDNALLAQVYAEAFAVSGDRELADIARRTLAFLTETMRTDNGLFASSLDADSLPFDEHAQAAPGARGAEGRVYLWSLPELKAALGEADALPIAALYGAGIEGNFEAGRSILRPMRTRAQLVADSAAGAIAGWPADAPRGPELLPWLDDALRRLAVARGRRPQPFRDDKCLAAANGLTLSALASAGSLLQDPALLDETARLAGALKAHLLPDGAASLRHQTFLGVASGEPDLLDHAAVARGLLDAGAALGAPELVADAFALAVQLLDRFEDPDGGAFFDTTGSDPLLPGRGRDVWDAALPSGTSLAVQVLLRLAPLDDSGRFAAAAQRAITRLAPLAGQAPAGFPALFAAFDMARGPLLEIVLDGSGPGFDALLGVTRRTLLPAALVVAHTERAAEALARLGLDKPSLLAERVAPPGDARAWVCIHRACLLPATTPEELAAQLAAPRR